MVVPVPRVPVLSPVQGRSQVRGRKGSVELSSRPGSGPAERSRSVPGALDKAQRKARVPQKRGKEPCRWGPFLPLVPVSAAFCSEGPKFELGGV